MKLPADGRLRCRGWLVGRLPLGVGHASAVRPAPSTLGVVGERGSRCEGRRRPIPGRLIRVAALGVKAPARLISTLWKVDARLPVAVCG
jgi:hypothetical protein